MRKSKVMSAEKAIETKKNIEFALEELDRQEAQLYASREKQLKAELKKLERTLRARWDKEDSNFLTRIEAKRKKLKMVMRSLKRKYPDIVRVTASPGWMWMPSSEFYEG